MFSRLSGRRKADETSGRHTESELSVIRTTDPRDEPSLPALQRRRHVSNDTENAGARSKSSHAQISCSPAAEGAGSVLLDFFRLIVHYEINIFQLPPGANHNIRRDLGDGASFCVDEVRLPVSDLLYEDLRAGRKYFRDNHYVDHTGKTWPLNTKVAFKTARLDAWSDAHYQDSKLRDSLQELRVLTHRPLQGHPNIVHLLAVTWNLKGIPPEYQSTSLLPGFPSIVTERATHGSLSDFLRDMESRQQPLPLKDKLGLCADILVALEALHACGVVHADIKCTNVLVFKSADASATNWRAKVSDFGYSIIDADASSLSPTNVLGTEFYSAPELDRSEHLQRTLLPAVDIWGWGMLLWCVLVDGKSYEHDQVDISTEHMRHFRDSGTVGQIAENAVRRHVQLQGHFDPDAALAPGVLRLLRKALHPDAIHRPTARQLMVELAQVEFGLPLRFGLRPDVEMDKANTLSSLPIFDIVAAYRHVEGFPYLAPFVVRELNKIKHMTQNKLGYREACTQLALCAIVDYGRDENKTTSWQSIEQACDQGSITAKGIAARVWANSAIPFVEAREKLEGWLADAARAGSQYAASDLRKLFPDTYLSLRQLKLQTAIHIGPESKEEPQLLIACREGNSRQAQRLLEDCAGAVPHGESGETPLHWLANFADHEVHAIALLTVSKGISVHERTHSIANTTEIMHYGNKFPAGTTALFWAIRRDALTATTVLLDLGALTDHETLAASARHQFIENPLCWAANFQSIGCARLLCDRFPKLVNHFDIYRKSPLYYAIVPSPFNQIHHLACRSDVQPSDSQQELPPAEPPQEQIVGMLVDHGCNLELVSKKSFGCLHLAAITDVRILRRLLRIPACRSKISSPDQNGITALANSIYSSRLDCFNALIDEGAILSLGNVPHQQHAIHFCCSRPTNTTLQMARKLLEQDPKCVNSTDRFGNTTLHVAASYAHVEMAELLLDNGASLTKSARNGLLPLGAALAAKSVTTVEFLCKKLKEAQEDLVARETKSGRTYKLAAFDFLLCPGFNSDRPSQMGFGRLAGCLDVPFSTTSTKILDILLQHYEYIPRSSWSLPKLFPRRHNDGSGIEYAVRTANMDVVTKLHDSRAFHQFPFDKKALVLVALRQLMCEKDEHVASEEDRRSMLDYVHSLWQDENTMRRMRRIGNKNVIQRRLWKSYYALYGGLAEREFSKWVVSQMKPRDPEIPLTKLNYSRYELGTRGVFQFSWLPLLSLWYAAHLCLFIPYWLYLARAMQDPLARVSPLNAISMVAAILIALLNGTWPKMLAVYSLYYDKYQDNLALRDLRLHWLQMAFLASTFLLWIFECWLLVSSSHRFVTFGGPKHAPSLPRTQAALSEHNAIAVGYMIFLILTQLVPISYFGAAHSGSYRFHNRGKLLNDLSARDIIVVGGKSIVP